MTSNKPIPWWPLCLLPLAASLALWLAPEALRQGETPILDRLYQFRSAIRGPAIVNPYLCRVAISPDDHNLAQVVAALAARGSGPVILDFLFRETPPDELAGLARAVAAHGKVWLPHVRLPDGRSIDPPAALLAAARGTVTASYEPDADGVVRRVTAAHLPDLILAEAAPALRPASAATDEQDRRLLAWPLGAAAEAVMPAISAQSLLDTAPGAAGASAIDAVIRDSLVVVCDLSPGSKDIMQAPGGGTASASLLWLAEVDSLTTDPVQEAPLAWQLLPILLACGASLATTRFDRFGAVAATMGAAGLAVAGVAAAYALCGWQWFLWPTLIVMAGNLAIVQMYRSANERSRLRLMELKTSQRLAYASVSRQAMIAFHDIANLASTSSCLLDLWRQAGHAPDAGDLARMETSVNRMYDLGRSALAMIEERRTSAPGVHDLGALVASSVAQLSETPGHDIRLEADSPAGGFWVRGTWIELAQVVEVLLQNAIQASASETVAVELRARGRNIAILAVADRGPGIPACLRCPWPGPLRSCLQCRRLGRSTKRNGNGVGINLVRAILHDLGGGLAIRAAPGGSRVAVSLPLVDKPENRP